MNDTLDTPMLDQIAEWNLDEWWDFLDAIDAYAPTEEHTRPEWFALQEALDKLIRAAMTELQRRDTPPRYGC